MIGQCPGVLVLRIVGDHLEIFGGLDIELRKMNSVRSSDFILKNHLYKIY